MISSSDIKYVYNILKCFEQLMRGFNVIEMLCQESLVIKIESVTYMYFTLCIKVETDFKLLKKSELKSCPPLIITHNFFHTISPQHSCGQSATGIRWMNCFSHFICRKEAFESPENSLKRHIKSSCSYMYYLCV